jgi:predicted RNase H-like nuclease (RuvC/YqgF family)
MSHDFIQNAVNNLYRDNELMALKGELSNLKAERDQLKADLEKSDGVVWTLSVENARLKAECQARQAENSVLAVECDSLKAEVERSTAQYNGIIDTQLAEIERLNSELHTCSCANANMHKYKAEVERLTKAGDAMASIIKYEPGVNAFDPVPDVVKRWNAAKEGKQS